VSDRLEVARIARAHGLRGDLVLAPISNRLERFAVGSILYDGDEPRTVVASRRQGDRYVVRFDGISDRTTAESLRGRVLTGERMDDRPTGEVWVHELIGAPVRDQHGRDLGVITHVEANPAHDLLATDRGVLIPMVFVSDANPRQVRVNAPEGLVELYLAE